MGCGLSEGFITRAEAAERVQNIYPLVGGAATDTHLTPAQAAETIPMIRWHMTPFFEQCLERHEEVKRQNGYNTKLKEYAYPSIDGH